MNTDNTQLNDTDPESTETPVVSLGIENNAKHINGTENAEEPVPEQELQNRAEVCIAKVESLITHMQHKDRASTVDEAKELELQRELRSTREVLEEFQKDNLHSNHVLEELLQQYMAALQQTEELLNAVDQQAEDGEHDAVELSEIASDPIIHSDLQDLQKKHPTALPAWIIDYITQVEQTESFHELVKQPERLLELHEQAEALRTGHARRLALQGVADSLLLYVTEQAQPDQPIAEEVLHPARSAFQELHNEWAIRFSPSTERYTTLIDRLPDIVLLLAEYHRNSD